MRFSMEPVKALSREELESIVGDFLASLHMGTVQAYVFRENLLGEPEWISLDVLRNEDGTWK